MNKTVVQSFILPFISEPGTRRIFTNGSQGSPERLGSGGEGREGAGLDLFLRNPELGGPAGVARREHRVRGSRARPQETEVPVPPGPETLALLELSESCPSNTQLERAGPQLWQLAEDAQTPTPPAIWDSVGSSHPCVPTGLVLRVIGRGLGWTAWPPPESAARVRSPRPGPARGRAAAYRHPPQGPGSGARAPLGPAPCWWPSPGPRPAPAKAWCCTSLLTRRTRRVTVILGRAHTHTFLQ